MFLKVVLVVILGFPPGTGGGDLGDDGLLPLAGGVDFSFHLFRDALLHRTVEKDDAAVRTALVITLAVQSGGIYDRLPQEYRRGLLVEQTSPDPGLKGFGRTYGPILTPSGGPSSDSDNRPLCAELY